ncbi:AlpA family transcriptional regulator [Rathayibacter sp. AY1A7]|uniref:helix-turn-helix transcriptional regulator n=1 Tax=Rathayibacter sp. AY1A7 TaxID=2080524 RepID=UPI000CE762A2|nr:helix-turn-helix domain-containing protein [Rathayibacter sp. AY1A7]PPF15228.1 hypothetical protein C5B95_16490 [Rathayibacter sp. AY1A7]
MSPRYKRKQLAYQPIGLVELEQPKIGAESTGKELTLMGTATLAPDSVAELRRRPVSELPEYLTRPELAAYTGIAPQTLARWASEGVGPKITRWNRAVRYKRADVIAFLNGEAA